MTTKKIYYESFKFFVKSLFNQNFLLFHFPHFERVHVCWVVFACHKATKKTQSRSLNSTTKVLFIMQKFCSNKTWIKMAEKQKIYCKHIV
jgi:hypothetical protein